MLRPSPSKLTEFELFCKGGWVEISVYSCAKLAESISKITAIIAVKIGYIFVFLFFPFFLSQTYELLLCGRSHKSSIKHIEACDYMATECGKDQCL